VILVEHATVITVDAERAVSDRVEVLAATRCAAPGSRSRTGGPSGPDRA
jgi:hypothetical protein